MEQTEQQRPAEGEKKPRGEKAAPARPRRKSKKKLVEQVIENIEKKLTSKDLKPSVGDFIRLLQLEKELEEEQPKEIKVSWVEPREEERASEK